MRARRCPGEDFALVCCDEDFPSTGYSWPELSHVRFPRFHMGLRAATMMISLLDEPQPFVPSEVIRHEYWPALPSHFARGKRENFQKKLKFIFRVLETHNLWVKQPYE
jgi:hypothetical protein